MPSCCSRHFQGGRVLACAACLAAWRNTQRVGDQLGRFMGAFSFALICSRRTDCSRAFAQNTDAGKQLTIPRSFEDVMICLVVCKLPLVKSMAWALFGEKIAASKTSAP